MSTQPPDAAQPWVTKILETIADSSPIRDGLHDDEAMPLIDWGTQCASHLGQRLAAPGTPAPEQVDNTAYSLTRLMTRINWLATYRTKKDAGWLTRTFQMINQLARELFGDDTPVMSDQEIAAWLTDNARLTNGEVVQALIARFSPAGLVAPPPVTPSTGQGPVLPGRDVPEAAPPVTPAAGPGPVLPGRTAPPLSEESSAPGENHDQTKQ